MKRIIKWFNKNREDILVMLITVLSTILIVIVLLNIILISTCDDLSKKKSTLETSMDNMREDLNNEGYFIDRLIVLLDECKESGIVETDEYIIICKNKGKSIDE